MAKHGGSTERVIAMMIEKLHDSDKLFRSIAVEALSCSAKQVRQQVTDALIRSLQDTDANVRCRAVKALRLASVGPSHPPVVAALAAMVRDENPFVQDAAVDNLQYAIRHAYFEVREELLVSTHKGVRTCALESFLEEIMQGSERALEIAMGMLQDPEFQVRMAAVGVISKFLTTRDTKAVNDQLAMLKAEGREHDLVAPAKADGPMIDKTLAGLMSALEDTSADIRTAVLRSLSCNTARLNQTVFKAVLVLLADEVDGTRQLAREWISQVVAFTQERERKEWAYNMVSELLQNGSGPTQLSAAWVVARVVANGNTKYLKDVLPLLEHERPLTRVAGLWALVEAVKNVVPSIMWSSSGGVTVPRCLGDPDPRCSPLAPP
jgi:HEAT repeat protein